MTSRPNLFEFATSELSQDAFLCWLLSWASSEHRSSTDDEARALHGVGVGFLEALCDCASVDDLRLPCTVKAERQVEHADIVAELGETHVLVIEDKIRSGEHSDQLRKYQEEIAAHYGDRDPILVYLKTGDQTGFGRVRGKGWSVFTRQDLLEVLREHGTSNAILVDFLARLEELEERAQQYRTLPVSKWKKKSDAYKGLYSELAGTLEGGAWHKVSNPTGGFLAFWWGMEKTPQRDGIYLQLEEKKLVVKVHVPDPSRQSRDRNRYSKLLCDALGEKFKKPKTFGKGDHMTIAEYKGDYRRTGPDGLLDLEATVKLLRDVTEEFRATVRGWGATHARRQQP